MRTLPGFKFGLSLPEGECRRLRNSSPLTGALAKSFEALAAPTAAGLIPSRISCQCISSLLRSSISIAFPLRLRVLVQRMPASGDKDLETHSSVVEFLSKGQGGMTDVQYASEFIQAAYPVSATRKVAGAIGDAFEALKRRERALPEHVRRERPRQWTERRVRALWFKEARRVDHYEIQDLTAVAVEEARRERQYLKARQERLAALIATFDPSEVGREPDEEGRGLRGVDLSGVGFTEADERADQSHGWGR